MLYLILFPLLGGAIGWVTNFLAIKFLFRPRRAWQVGKLKFQGVIPRRRRELAQAVGQVVATELLSREQVAAALNAPEIRVGMANMAGDAAAERFQAHPILSPLPRGLRVKIANYAGTLVQQEVDNILRGSGSKMTGKVLDSVDLGRLVQEKVEGMDWDYLEGIVYSVAGRELKLIEIMGGVLGAVVGLVQALVVLIL